MNFMKWIRKYSNYFGHFEHHTDNGLITIFKDDEGYKYKFSSYVNTSDESGGYGATSIHFWKTLSAVKKHIESTKVHAMAVTDNDKITHLDEYIVTDRIELVSINET